MRERRFKIETYYTPATIPMLRLAEYMNDLAILLGEPASVHFERIEEGSAALIHRIDDAAIPKVDDRLSRTRQGQGPSDAMSAAESINRRLREDNGTGVYIESSGIELIRFPGRNAITPILFGAFNEPGTLDGQVIRVGGTADPVPVHIQSVEQRDKVYICYASRTVAKELAPHIFGPELRVSGSGRWTRDADGRWNLERFTITSFVLLKDEPLSAIVAALRKVPGSEWDALTDPWAELDRIRNGPPDAEE